MGMDQGGEEANTGGGEVYHVVAKERAPFVSENKIKWTDG